MTDSVEEIIQYRRRPRVPPALFIQIGDLVAEIIIVGILIGGFLTSGYAQIPRWMWMVNGGCALLGTWAVAGLLLGRWQDPTMRASSVVDGGIHHRRGLVGSSVGPVPERHCHRGFPALE
jgi:hypothetical protein